MMVKTAEKSTASALAIIKLEARRVCPAAYIDGGAPDANDHARREADALGDAFQCGRDKPRIIGGETQAVRDIAALAD